MILVLVSLLSVKLLKWKSLATPWLPWLPWVLQRLNRLLWLLTLMVSGVLSHFQSSSSLSCLSDTLLGPVPQRMQCKYCQMIMETSIKKRVTRYTHFFALAFCLTGLLCLVPLPYCLKSCQSLDHYCTSCNQFLGKAAN
ncbi:uncharacterized protein LOC6640670 isoform X1 [Drosophila willistoni]|uniref:uncharacterized protein LOC6640670 isoform X1 n=1 Tax=Drosophila willistoni TaxID=7260 RepID=UPI000C26C29D|nr:uncharacterized protein LOC6640670 isoform X1 [Drosophila willistoni]